MAMVNLQEALKDTGAAGLMAAGVMGDWREPDVLRLAPAPLYNSFSDVFATVVALEKAVRG